jgi:hypothetical protein
MSKIKVLSGFILLASLISCQQYPSEQEIIQNIDAGNFSMAEQQIQLLLQDKSLPDSLIKEWADQVEIMDRIRKDFSMSKDDIKRSLIRYFPNLNDSMLLEWEAGRRRTELDGKPADKLYDYYSEYAGTVIEKVKKSGTNTIDEKRFSITFSVSLNHDAVPDGEVVRCWLPFPSVHPQRQVEVKLLETNCDTYQVAPPEAPQRTIYLEKTAIRDSATIFQVSFEVKTAAQWFNVIPEEVLPYDITSQLFLEYTKERPPHIVFSDQISDLSRQIVGNEKNPVRIVRKIFQWINDNIPWASALEYSTVKCIPGYVLENRHGDCGMQSLLFITLARYNGIPAKWQSGWYMFPVQTNMHDWAEVYYEGTGWVPVDQSFGLIDSENETIKWFYTQGLDPFRLIINEDFSRELYPPKQFLRSETVDFQRGELEWKEGNLYFDQWDYTIKVTPIVSDHK